MRAGDLARKESEIWRDLWEQYQESHPGPFRVEDMIEWAVSVGGVPLPNVNPRRILERRARRALREVRIQDPSGEVVRGMLPAKLPRVDAKGNMVFEVFWDQIHRMSADHGMLSFDQRDGNIHKQRSSATRDLRSFLAFNPNVKGKEDQFVFDFITEDQSTPVVQKIEEAQPKPKPR